MLKCLWLKIKERFSRLADSKYDIFSVLVALQSPCNMLYWSIFIKTSQFFFISSVLLKKKPSNVCVMKGEQLYEETVVSYQSSMWPLGKNSTNTNYHFWEGIDFILFHFLICLNEFSCTYQHLYTEKRWYVRIFHLMVCTGVFFVVRYHMQNIFLVVLTTCNIYQLLYIKWVPDRD